MLHTQPQFDPIMPLLIGFTPTTPIQEYTQDDKFVYNDTLQITEYSMSVGTKCLRNRSTDKRNKNGGLVSRVFDAKNEIDDTK